MRPKKKSVCEPEATNVTGWFASVCLDYKKNSPYNMMGFVDFRDFKSCTPICVIGGNDSLKDKHKYN